MSAPMRWGDSDSSEEDEIRVSDLQKQESADDDAGFLGRQPPSTHNKPTPPPSSSLQQGQNRGGPPAANNPKGRGRGRGGGRDNHHQQGGRGGTGGTGGGGGRQQQHQQDWKSMAKSASKYTQESLPSVDGSAWMASRRAKLQQQEEESSRKVVEDAKHQEEQKRQRRKSQMEALKLAMVERQKLDLPAGPAAAPSGSSLEAAATSRKSGPAEDDVSVQSNVSGTSSRGGNTTGTREAGHGGDRGDSWRSAEGRGGGGGRGGVRGDSWRSHDAGRGRGDRSDSWRSHDSGAGRGRGGGRSQDGGRSGGGGRSQDGGRGRGNRGGAAQHQDAKRSNATNKGQVQVGKPQVVRTPSGDIQFHIEIVDTDKPKTKGELMPNGSVRLSKRGGASKGGNKGKQPQSPTRVQHNKKSKSKSPTRSNLTTTLEIGKD